jgi:hypothetical protein
MPKRRIERHPLRAMDINTQLGRQQVRRRIDLTGRQRQYVRGKMGFVTSLTAMKVMNLIFRRVLSVFTILLLSVSTAQAQTTNWIDEPYDAANFKARMQNGDHVTWQTTAQGVSVYKYLMLQPDTMLLHFDVEMSVITTTPLLLMIKLPGGYKAAGNTSNTITWWENVYDDSGIGIVASDMRHADFLKISKIPSAQIPPKASNTWMPSNGTYVAGQIIVRVARP